MVGSPLLGWVLHATMLGFACHHVPIHVQIKHRCGVWRVACGVCMGCDGLIVKHVRLGKHAQKVAMVDTKLFFGPRNNRVPLVHLQVPQTMPVGVTGTVR